MKSAAAIAFDHRPSRWIAAAAAAVLAIALAAIAASGIGAWLQWPLGVAAAAYAAFEVRRFLSSPVQRLAWHEAGHWRVLLRDGAEHTAELRHAIVRGAWIVLILQRGAARLPIVLGPDNCDADTRRRLRVRLGRAPSDLQPAA